MTLPWDKPRLIKLVTDVQTWIDDIEKFTVNVFPPILKDAPAELVNVRARFVSGIGLSPLRSALSILLTISNPDYKNAKALEIKFDEIDQINPLPNDTSGRGWVQYRGNEHLAIYKRASTHVNLRAELAALTQEVEGLSLALHDADALPDLHVLHSPGFFWDNENSRFGILFRPPRNASSPTSAESLSEYLAKPELKSLRASLCNRVSLAKALADALYRLHSLGWLHKSFRPSNVLLFDRLNPIASPNHLPRIAWAEPYILGFELSRSEAQDSARVIHAEEREWAVKMYLHPERLEKKTPEFNRIHDIYSLGVMLLEVGRLAPLGREKDRWETLSAGELRQEFLKLARGLVENMGPKYAEIVEVCLLSDFGVQYNEADYDRKLLSAFQLKVCQKLGGIQF
jgi:hypothetical protein